MAKPFPEDVIEKAWVRSCGCCECRRPNHGHGDMRCCRALKKENRGRDGEGAWEAHHLNPDTPPVLGNCRIYCWPCHRPTI